MTVYLDHILWGTPDLSAGEKLFEQLSGVKPGKGGIHEGFGTRNSLLSMGEDLFFEIIAPDPAQNLNGNRGGRLAKLAGPGLTALSVRSDDLPAMEAAAKKLGLPVRGPIPGGRTRTDGVRLNWEILYFGEGQDADMIPFAIDWKGSPHPASTTPGGIGFKSVVALHPDSERLSAIYKALGIPVPVLRGDRAGFQAVLTSPRGDITLTTAA